MKVSMQQCKRRLAILWFISSSFLFIIMLIQSFLGHYGNDITDAWGWFLPTVMPTLSLIVGVLVSDALGKGVRIQKVSNFLFRLAFSLSLAYLLVVILTILFQPFSTLAPLDLMKQSHLWLGPFQGLVSASLGAFFIRSEGD
jgi:hypothetical protein